MSEFAAVGHAASGEMMVEGKAALTDRLRRENLWDEACRFRDRVRNELRAQGMSRRESNEQAWERTAREFPPISKVREPAPTGTELIDDADEALSDAELEQLSAKAGSSSFEADFEWAYNHLGAPGTTAVDAPSPAAWYLLSYGREARTKFIEMAVKLFTNPRRQAERELRRFVEDDQRRQFAFIEQLKADYDRDDRRHLERMMGTSPELVVTVLREGGWNVVPPTWVKSA